MNKRQYDYVTGLCLGFMLGQISGFLFSGAFIISVLCGIAVIVLDFRRPPDED